MRGFPPEASASAARTISTCSNENLPSTKFWHRYATLGPSHRALERMRRGLWLGGGGGLALQPCAVKKRCFPQNARPHLHSSTPSTAFSFRLHAGSEHLRARFIAPFYTVAQYKL